MNGCLLNPCGNHMLSGSLVGKCGTDQCHIVALRPPGGQNDLLWLAFQRPGNLLYRFGNITLCLNSLGMSGGRISKILFHYLQHNITHLRKHPGGCCII